jgi:hypothetical protein
MYTTSKRLLREYESGMNHLYGGFGPVEITPLRLRITSRIYKNKFRVLLTVVKSRPKKTPKKWASSFGYAKHWGWSFERN